MRFISLLVLSAALLGQATAQSGCPVDIDSPSHTRLKPFGTHVTVRYKNVSDKVMIGVKLGLELLDDVGDAHDVFANIASSRKREPSKSNTIIADILLLDVPPPPWKRDNVQRNGLRAYLVKVLYEDGTVWEDDGTHSCVSLVH